MERTKSADRWRVPDEPREKIRPRPPERPNPHKFGGGRPRQPGRVCADAIFFRPRTGCQWKALDATGLCPGPTAHDRFQEWVRAGAFPRRWRAGLLEYDGLRGSAGPGWRGAGAGPRRPSGGKTGRNPTDRGKIGTRRSLLVEAAGIPAGVAVEGANRHDFRMARQAIASIPSERPTPTSDAPPGMRLDKGYDYNGARELLGGFAFTAHSRARGEEAQAREAGYRARRWVVERTPSWLNRYRAVLIRRCKEPQNFLATLHFAFALVPYRAAGLTG